MSKVSVVSEGGTRSGRHRAAVSAASEGADGPERSALVSSAKRSLSPVVAILVGSAALVIVLAGLRAVSGILGPVFLGLIITISLHPLRARLERTRLPGWLISTFMLLMAYVILSLLILSLLLSMSQLAELIPAYSVELQGMVASVGTALGSLGVDPAQVDALTASLDPGRLFDVAMTVLSSSFGLVANIFFLATVLLFFTFDTASTRRGLAYVGERHLQRIVGALTHFAQGTRRYMRVSTNFGLIVAVVDGVVLYLLDVPGAFAWAVLAFVTNFIPNIGFVIGLVPPAFIALMDGGTGMMLTVIVLYSVINFVIQSMIQPRVVGDAVGLSASLTFLSLAFWTWLIGPIGAVLAVPLSLLTKALLVEVDPEKNWVLPLIAGKSGEGEGESEEDPDGSPEHGASPEESVAAPDPRPAPAPTPTSADPADDGPGERTPD